MHVMEGPKSQSSNHHWLPEGKVDFLKDLGLREQWDLETSPHYPLPSVAPTISTSQGCLEPSLTFLVGSHSSKSAPA